MSQHKGFDSGQAAALDRLLSPTSDYAEVFAYLVDCPLCGAASCQPCVSQHRDSRSGQDIGHPHKARQQAGRVRAVLLLVEVDHCLGDQGVPP